MAPRQDEPIEQVPTDALHRSGFAGDPHPGPHLQAHGLDGRDECVAVGGAGHLLVPRHREPTRIVEVEAAVWVTELGDHPNGDCRGKGLEDGGDGG